jgi:hypothetical protein
MARNEQEIVGDWVRIAVDEETRTTARKLAAIVGLPLNEAVKLALRSKLREVEGVASEIGR